MADELCYADSFSRSDCWSRLLLDVPSLSRVVDISAQHRPLLLLKLSLEIKAVTTNTVAFDGPDVLTHPSYGPAVVSD